MKSWRNEHINKWTKNKRTDVPTDKQMSIWTDKQMNRWKDALVYRWTYERMNWWLDEQMNKLTDKWMNRHMNEQRNTWTNKFTSRLTTEKWTECMDSWRDELMNGLTNEKINVWTDKQESKFYRYMRTWTSYLIEMLTNIKMCELWAGAESASPSSRERRLALRIQRRFWGMHRHLFSLHFTYIYTLKISKEKDHFFNQR